MDLHYFTNRLLHNRTKKILLLNAIVITLTGCAASHRLLLAARYKIVRVPTGAMQPTIKIGDYAAVDREYYKKNPVQRFDMMVFQNPEPNERFKDADKYLLKRVIGLGGEQLEISFGKVLINHQELAQPFQTTPDDSMAAYGPISIPEGDYFLLGDNRPNSFDSRHWNKHTIDKSVIYGKVVEIIPGEK